MTSEQEKLRAEAQEAFAMAAKWLGLLLEAEGDEEKAFCKTMIEKYASRGNALREQGGF